MSVLLLVALPLLVQSPALTGVLSANPLYKAAWLRVDPVRQILPGSGWVDDNAGVTTQALGHLAAEDWLHGRLPWWNDDAGLGMPLAAEMQNSALFLPFVLLLHFANGLIWLKLCLQLLTGLFTLCLLRTLGLGWRGAIVGGVLAELCGTLAWFSHGPMMPVPFLPLLLLGIERARRQDSARSGIALVALAIAGSIAAGFPETAFVDGLLALCVAAWRVVQAGRRWSVLGCRIACGGLLGIAIGTPAWLPFLESLPISFLGQNDGVGSGHLLAGSYALLLFPYVFGPLLYGFDKLPSGVELWWHTDGYCDLAVVFCAGLAFCSRKDAPERGLRFVLLGWLVASVLKAAGLFPVPALFDLIPGIRQTVFHLYASPGWEFALAMLASFAVDDLDHRRGPSTRAILAVAGVAVIAGGAALLAAWPSVAALAQCYPSYAVYPACTVMLMAAAIGVLARLFAHPATTRARNAIAILLALDAVTMFAVPVLSGARHPHADLGPVRFLRANLGLQRFYSAILFAPNYGSYFGLASLNWNALPVPRALTERIGHDLDPGMDMTGLFGWKLFRLGPDVQDPADEQITAVTALSRLEALGVAYLVVPHTFDPLRSEINIQAARGPQLAMPLASGRRIEGVLPAGLTGAASIDQVGVRLGTYGGRPSGDLAVTLCDGTRCATGHGGLSGASDGGILWLPLDRPLETGADDAIAYAMTVGDLRGQAAVWMVPLPAPLSAAKSGPGLPPGSGPGSSTMGSDRAPFLLMRLRSRAQEPQRAYSDTLFDVLRLPDPAPYFGTVSGHCRLRASSRRRVEAACSAPDRLIRRALFYPGWSAEVNGQAVELQPFDRTFQSLALPAGRSAVRLRYAPPHMLFGWLASLIGLCMAVPLLFRRRNAQTSLPSAPAVSEP